MRAVYESGQESDDVIHDSSDGACMSMLLAVHAFRPPPRVFVVLHNCTGLSAKLQVRGRSGGTSFAHHPRDVLLRDLVEGRRVEGHTPRQACLCVSAVVENAWQRRTSSDEASAGPGLGTHFSKHWN